VRREHHEHRRLERARPAHRIERILQVVRTCGDGDAGAAQRIDSGEPARDGLAVASTEPQVGVGECDDPDVRRRHQLGDSLLLGGAALPQADAVARGDPVGESGEDLP
jgi:hypothetical protein